MTSTMRKRRGPKLSAAPETSGRKQPNIRRETFITVPSSQLPQTEEEEEEADLGTPARPASTHEAPLLQTNGKLPMWFRKLQGQGGASLVVQSDAEPRQVRSRWAEQPNPLIICSNFSPGQAGEGEEEEEEEREEEEEEDFHPQSLESMLGEEEEEEEEEEGEEEKEVLQNPGEDRSSYILYPNANNTTDREFDVEGVNDPRRSLTQLEVKGQAEPAWSTQLSPDSACSEGSAGSLEQQHDADTDSLSQGSSVGSLCLEDDDDRNSLKNHFETLNDEKFDTDLKTLQPPDEKHFLNPRLSISTRFLSRFQDRVRGWPSRAPASVSIPARISEESNVSSTSVNSEPISNAASTESTQKENNNTEAKSNRSVLRRRASCMISQQSLQRTRRRRHTVVVVQCRESLRDATSRTHNSSVASSVQQGAPRLGYLGTTASSRAKQSQEETPPSPSDLQPPAQLLPAGLDRPGTKPDPQKDQTSSVALTSQHHVPAASPQVVVTPTETRRWSLSSVEETPTNQNQTLVLSPATTCDIITSDITCPASRQVEGPAGSETRTQTDPDPSVGAESFSSDPPTSSSSPLSEILRPPQTGSSAPSGSGDAEESVSLQQCQQVANELRQTARRAVHLYQQLCVPTGCSERRLQMSSVLQEAFDFVNGELQAVVRGGDGRGGGAPCGRLEDDGTRLLLEKYSDQLVQMTQNKLDRMVQKAAE